MLLQGPHNQVKMRPVGWASDQCPYKNKLGQTLRRDGPQRRSRHRSHVAASHEGEWTPGGGGGEPQVLEGGRRSSAPGPRGREEGGGACPSPGERREEEEHTPALEGGGRRSTPQPWRGEALPTADLTFSLGATCLRPLSAWSSAAASSVSALCFAARLHSGFEVVPSSAMA